MRSGFAPFDYRSGEMMMTRSINQGILKHLFELHHPDLQGGIITRSLIEQAGEAVCDMMLDLGFHLQESYQDAGDVVHTYLNPRSGQLLEGLTFSLEILMDEKRGPNLHLLLRAAAPAAADCLEFLPAMRRSRGWYRPLSNACNAQDLVNATLPGEVGANDSLSAFEWQLAA